jgi:hypothetical protein
MVTRLMRALRLTPRRKSGLTNRRTGARMAHSLTCPLGSTLLIIAALGQL